MAIRKCDDPTCSICGTIDLRDDAPCDRHGAPSLNGLRWRWATFGLLVGLSLIPSHWPRRR